MAVYADRVKETSTTTGLGPITVLGASVGFRSFSVFADGVVPTYVIEAVDGNGVPTGQWEVVKGAVGAGGTTLARTTLISSSTGSPINFAAGTKNVFCDQAADEIVSGPGPLVDNAIPRMDGTTGKIIQGYTSGAPTISDTGAMTITLPLQLKSTGVTDTYSANNSGVFVTNAAGDELLRMWASDPNTANYNGANLYIGCEAGFSQPSTAASTAGFYNAGIGFRALYANTTGYENAAFGADALRFNTTGYGNAGLGVEALWHNTVGYSNMAVGVLSLNANISGNENTAVGAYALGQNTTGNLNTAIGYYARNAGNFSNTIAIGSNVVVTSNNRAVIGSVTVTDVYFGSETAAAAIRAASLYLGSSLVTLAGAFTTSGANALTLTTTGATNVTLPTSGSLATTTQLADYLPLAGGTLTGPITGTSGIIEQRNSTTAQKLYISGTYTDGSNYERLEIGYGVDQGSTWGIVPRKLGSGTLRLLQIGAYNNSQQIDFYGGNAKAWRINHEGSDSTFRPSSDNQQDIGVSTNRIQNFYLGTALISDTTTGFKIGTATTQKLGLWNVTPIIQPAATAQAAFTDSTGGTPAASLVDVATAGIGDPAKINANFATVSVLLLAMRTAMVNFGSMKGAA